MLSILLAIIPTKVSVRARPRAIGGACEKLLSCHAVHAPEFKEKINKKPIVCVDLFDPIQKHGYTENPAKQSDYVRFSDEFVTPKRSKVVSKHYN